MADEREFELKRLEAAFKTFDAATERHFRLATFTMAGNVGAIVVCSLAVKDFKEKFSPSAFESALSFFVTGAIVSAICLGLVIITTESIALSNTKALSAGPTRHSNQTKIFDRAGSTLNWWGGLCCFHWVVWLFGAVLLSWHLPNGSIFEVTRFRLGFSCRASV